MPESTCPGPINRLGKYGIDPEAQNVGYYYPQQRTISLGLNISF